MVTDGRKRFASIIGSLIEESEKVEAILEEGKSVSVVALPLPNGAVIAVGAGPNVEEMFVDAPPEVKETFERLKDGADGDDSDPLSRALAQAARLPQA